MNVVALALEQALFANRWQKARDRAVKEHARRDDRLVPQIHPDRMTLVGANHRAVGAEGEALLVAPLHELLEVGQAELSAMLCERAQQSVDAEPAPFIEDETDCSGFVSQHETQELG